jgi:predicted acyl esterase
VPARDGVVLATDVYRPTGPGPFPVLFERSLYHKSAPSRAERTAAVAPRSRTEIAAYFVGHGYAVAYRDCRGRYRSGAHFTKYLSEAEDGCDALGWLQRQALVQRPCRHLRAVLCGPHAGRARLPRPAGTDGAVPRLRRLLQRLPQRHPPGGALDLKQATWAYRNALADARDPEVKAALAALDIRAWFRRMRWRRGDSPISAAPEYEDYLFEQWSHGIFDDYWRQPGIYAEGF